METDTSFRFDWVPGRYADRVQRLAVLYALCGRCRSVSQISNRTSAVLAAWRARVSSLAEAGWFPEDSTKVAYHRNCLPTFVYCTPRTCLCGSRAVCPFCYARWVHDVWEKIDAAFPNARNDSNIRHATTDIADVDDTIEDRAFREAALPPGSHQRAIAIDGDGANAVPHRVFQYHLITRVRRYVYPRNDPEFPDIPLQLRARGLMELFLRRAPRIDLRKLKANAAFSNLTIEPGRRGLTWVIRTRALYKVPADFVAPPEWGDHSRCDTPTRNAIMCAVANVCKYPRRMMRGPADMVVAILAARSGLALNTTRLRTSAMYGEFRDDTEQTT